MKVELHDITQLVSSGFEALPSQLYGYDLLPKVPNKIDPTFFQTALLIAGKGRVVLYDNPNLFVDGKKAIALGHFECIDDDEVADLLFHEAEKTARQMDATWLIGPMNGSTWDSYRYSLTQESPAFFLEPHHHLYYNRLWQNSGFDIMANYNSSMDKQMDLFEPERLAVWQTMMDDMGVVIRPVDAGKYEEEIAKVHTFCEMAFAENYLYTPIAEKEFVKKYIPLKNIMDTELVILAEDADKKVIAVFFAIPDLYNKTTPTLIVKTIARNPMRQYAGLMHLMCNIVVAAAKRKGFKQMIHAFMHDDNKSNNVSGKFSGEVFRKYALYGKKIN